jgi:hypothetical protein
LENDACPIMKQVSKHISYREAIKSEVAKRNGINNYFTVDQLYRMVELAENVFEPLREHFKVPIYISSFFRNKQLNDLIGGVKDSQHLCNNGAAIDLDGDVYSGVTNKQIFDYIKDNLTFDQLILENVSTDGTGGWVHVSYNKGNNRKEVLTMKLVNGKKVYEEYIT